MNFRGAQNEGPGQAMMLKPVNPALTPSAVLRDFSLPTV